MKVGTRQLLKKSRHMAKKYAKGSTTRKVLAKAIRRNRQEIGRKQTATYYKMPSRE